MVTVLKRAYFSPYHLFSANHFLELAASIEDSHTGRDHFDFYHNSFVIGSIISSATFLEAAINEIYQDVFDEHNNYIEPLDNDARKALKSFWSKYERSSILRKYQFALTTAKLEPFPEKENPYADVDLAIQLRHQLIHYKPETFGGGESHELTEVLGGKFKLNPLMSSPSNQFFPDKCLGKGCAEWVLKSCLSLADEFFERIQITPNYQLNKEIDISTLRTKLNIMGSE